MLKLALLGSCFVLVSLTQASLPDRKSVAQISSQLRQRSLLNSWSTSDSSSWDTDSSTGDGMCGCSAYLDDSSSSSSSGWSKSSSGSSSGSSSSSSSGSGRRRMKSNSWSTSDSSDCNRRRRRRLGKSKSSSWSTDTDSGTNSWSTGSSTGSSGKWSSDSSSSSSMDSSDLDDPCSTEPPEYDSFCDCLCDCNVTSSDGDSTTGDSDSTGANADSTKPDDADRRIIRRRIPGSWSDSWDTSDCDDGSGSSSSGSSGWSTKSGSKSKSSSKSSSKSKSSSWSSDGMTTSTEGPSTSGTSRRPCPSTTQEDVWMTCQCSGSNATTTTAKPGCPEYSNYFVLDGGFWEMYFAPEDRSVVLNGRYDQDGDRFVHESRNVSIWFEEVSGNDYVMVIGEPHDDNYQLIYKDKVSTWTDSDNPLTDSAEDAEWEGNSEILEMATGNMTLFDCEGNDLGTDVETDFGFILENSGMKMYSGAMMMLCGLIGSVWLAF